MRIGRNVWYLAANGRSSRGVLKTRHGRVLEVGVLSRSLTAGRAHQRLLLRALG